MSANLTVFDIRNFYVILGMEWLVDFHASMDCFNKTITLKLDEGNALFEGTKRSVSNHLISAMGYYLVKAECEGYIAFITEDK